MMRLNNVAQCKALIDIDAQHPFQNQSENFVSSMNQITSMFDIVGQCRAGEIE